MEIDYTSLQQLLNNRMELDDTFQFRCKACGKCCSHRDDVFLMPYDVFRIAKDLTHTPKDIIDRYCNVFFVDSSLPVVNIRPNPPDNACPFLRNRKCIIHKSKPLVCAVYPLARLYIYGEERMSYMMQPNIHCGHSDRTVSVRQWMGPLCNAESERVGKEWGDIALVLALGIQKIGGSTVDIQKKTLTKMAFETLYLSYDIRKPFLPQLENNAVDAFLIGIMALGLEDVPEWLSIPDTLTPIGKCDLLLRKAYHLYKLQWCAQRGLTLMEGELQNAGDSEDACFITLKEFTPQFLNAEIVQSLLQPDDFRLWQGLGDIAALLDGTESRHKWLLWNNH